MLREHVRKGSKAAIIEISLKGGVKHDKTSLNALSTHEQCWLYTDVYSFYVVTGHVFRRCGHNSFIFWTRWIWSENWHDWDEHSCGWQGNAGNFAKSFLKYAQKPKGKSPWFCVLIFKEIVDLVSLKTRQLHLHNLNLSTGITEAQN